MEENTFTNRVEIDKLVQTAQAVKDQIGQAVFGQEETIDLMMVGLLSDGHLLLEGVPGVAKTLLSKLFSRCLNISFGRIQFTPDLMPSDVLGTSVFNPKTLEFDYKRGPIFKNFILIDEINRSPAKTQAALFEVMEERQVTIDGTTYPIQEPFLVVATQNPVEQEGTYQLPEAQLDRFLLHIKVTYPSPEDELKMLSYYNGNLLNDSVKQVNQVLEKANFDSLKQIVHEIKVEESLLTYISQIVLKTRDHNRIELGASPRAAIALLKASKAYAALQNRDFVIPEDIKHIGIATLRHRIMLTPEAEIEGITADVLLKDLFKSIEIPS